MTANLAAALNPQGVPGSKLGRVCDRNLVSTSGSLLSVPWFVWAVQCGRGATLPCSASRVESWVCLRRQGFNLSLTSASVFCTLSPGCILKCRISSIALVAELKMCILWYRVVFSWFWYLPWHGFTPVMNWNAIVNSANDVVVMSSTGAEVSSVLYHSRLAQHQ